MSDLVLHDVDDDTVLRIQAALADWPAEFCQQVWEGLAVVVETIDPAGGPVPQGIFAAADTRPSRHRRVA